MASLKDDVLAALAKVASPQGQKLTETGTLSDVVVTDGKVFFSISVDAGAVKEWESVRARAEAATRAVPGVQSVLVALTAERASGVGRYRATTASANAARGGAAARRRRRRRRPAFPASPRSSPLRRAKAASANRPPRSISRWACATSA